MPPYQEEKLPPESIDVGEKTWRREKIDSHTYQWTRPLEETEYDWDDSQVDLVGVESPIRSVMLRWEGDEWSVGGAETAGPDYHRPGFTELISSEFSDSAESVEDAGKKVREYIQRLS